MIINTYNEIKQHYIQTELAYKLTKSYLIKSNTPPNEFQTNRIIKLGKSVSDLNTIIIQFENVAHLIEKKSSKRLIEIEDSYFNSLINSWNENNPTEIIFL